MAAIALLVVNFDFELEQYVYMDGSKFDRGPKDDSEYLGVAALPPDHDVILRWKKV